MVLFFWKKKDTKAISNHLKLISTSYQIEKFRKGFIDFPERSMDAFCDKLLSAFLRISSGIYRIPFFVVL